MSASDRVSDPIQQPAGFVWKRAAIGLVGLVVILFGVGYLWQWLGGGAMDRLGEVVDRLDESDPGWRLTEIDQAQDDIPDVRNSAVVVRKTARLLPAKWASFKFRSQFDVLIREPTARLPPESAALLQHEMADQTAALAEARQLAALPRGRYPADLVRRPAHLNEEVNKVFALLGFDAMNQAQNGHLAEALLACRAGVNVGRSLGDGVQFDYGSTRISSIQVPSQVLEWVLGQGEPAEADLAALQQLLSEEEKHPTLVVVRRGQRALVDDMFTKMENGTVKVESLVPASGLDLKTRLLGLSKKALRDEHARILELTTRRVEIARLPEHMQEPEDRKLDAELRSLPREAILTMQMVHRDEMGEMWRTRTARLRTMLVLLAVERYRLKQKKWPDRLDDLKPDFLAAVPNDPFDGKPLRYARRADGVTVYSVGTDKRDDGGRVRGGGPGKGGSDIGYRLWDVKARRQPPTPGKK
jgi:hypothetical protein